MKEEHSSLLNEAIKSNIEGIFGDNDVTVFVSKRKDKPYKDYAVVFQPMLYYLIVTAKVSQSAIFIVSYLFSIVGFENTLSFTQIGIAEKLNISRKTVNKAIKKLLELKVIEVYSDLNDKRINTYRLNPQLLWKGKESNRKKALKNTPKGNYIIDFDNPTLVNAIPLTRPEDTF